MLGRVSSGLEASVLGSVSRTMALEQPWGSSRARAAGGAALALLLLLVSTLLFLR